jgi:hypothetical protein
MAFGPFLEPGHQVVGHVAQGERGHGARLGDCRRRFASNLLARPLFGDKIAKLYPKEVGGGLVS